MQTEFTIKYSRVIENAIILYSNSNENYAAIATIDKAGNIKAEWSLVQKYRKEHKKERIIAGLKGFLYFLAPTLILATIFTILAFRGTFTGRYAFKNILQFSLICDLAVILLALLYRPKKRLKLKSASNMLINAYQDLGRLPSLEEISKYSGLTNFDGTNSLMLTVVTDILMLFCLCINNQFIAIIACLIVLLFIKPKLEMLAYIHGFLNFSQAFSTMAPTDLELKVAISAMKVWIENEGYK